MSLSPVRSQPETGYAAAKSGVAHRIRPASVLEIEGQDRAAFLQGQLTQDVLAMRPGDVRPAAALTPKGKLVLLTRLQALPDRLRLLFDAASRQRVREHLEKYAVFQKVSVVDQSENLVRMGLYGPKARLLEAAPGGSEVLAGEGEFASELIVPLSALAQVERWLETHGSTALSEASAESLRIETGRPRFGRDADETNFADELGIDEAISTTKGCYVGQEIVARLRTYGRVNRRLVGFRFPDGEIRAGALLKRPEEKEPGKIEQGRVTSSIVSPAFGPIGLGFAFREIPAGGRLIDVQDPSRVAVVAQLPFA